MSFQSLAEDQSWNAQTPSRYTPDYLSGVLPVEDIEALLTHTVACSTCRGKLTGAEETWQQSVPGPGAAPDLPAMRNTRSGARRAPGRARQPFAKRSPAQVRHMPFPRPVVFLDLPCEVHLNCKRG